MSFNPDKAATSNHFLFMFELVGAFNTAQTPSPPLGILSASVSSNTYHYPTNNERTAKETFMLTSTILYRLCPMLNGTCKPEDRPDGQGDSSFGAVPAALTL